MSLENQNDPLLLREAAGGFQPIPLNLRYGAAQQSGHLPRMGGEHQGRASCFPYMYMPGHGVYAIRIQH